MQDVSQDQMDHEVISGQVETVKAGVIDFALDYRHFGGDEGVTIRVMANLKGKETELLRFDCFDDAPHYHYGPDGPDERLMLDYTAEGDPIPWAINRLRTRMVPMLVRAGHPDTARKLDHSLIRDRLDQVEAWAQTLSRTKGS